MAVYTPNPSPTFHWKCEKIKDKDEETKIDFCDFTLPIMHNAHTPFWVHTHTPFHWKCENIRDKHGGSILFTAKPGLKDMIR